MINNKVVVKMLCFDYTTDMRINLWRQIEKTNTTHKHIWSKFL